MTWKGEETPGQPGDAIQAERRRMNWGSKRGKRLASRDLKGGQIDSIDEMFRRTNGDFQAEGFWFYSQGIVSHREFLEFWFLVFFFFTTDRIWRWICDSLWHPGPLLDNDLGYICSWALQVTSQPNPAIDPQVPVIYQTFLKVFLIPTKKSPRKLCTLRRPKPSSTSE